MSEDRGGANRGGADRGGADRGSGAQPPRPRRTGGGRGELESRTIAFQVLQAVRAEGSYANLLLGARLRHAGLSARDAGFVTELVAGTLRRQGTYDAILATCVARSLNRVDPEVLDILRMGAHQLLTLRTPPHAVINTAVDLARAEVGRSVTGFVNAVLRKVAAKQWDAWMLRLAPPLESDPVGHLALVHSHPRWVVEELAAALARPGSPGALARPGAPGALARPGAPAAEQTNELAQLLAAHNEPPAVTLVARPGRSRVEELPGQPGRWSPYAVISAGGNPGDLPAVREGRAGVQDEGSQLVALALTRAELSGSDARWLDVCAGPGGKAALLAGLADAQGAGVLAAELQPHRAVLVAQALLGAGGVRGVIAADGLRPPWTENGFDRALVDAPCSGLGALRRRPEARWRKTPEQIAELVDKQVGLLTKTLDSVRPGGVVLYATCTPVLAETEGVVAAVLASRPDVALEDAMPLVAPVPDCAGPLPGTVQLWPHRHGTDAMFLALLRRQ